MMKLETFEAILTKYVIPYKHMNEHCPPTVIMHKDGEPWLNKRLPDMLRMVAEKDPSLKIDIYTHGLQFKREHWDLLESLPNKVRMLVSFHFNNHDGTTNDYTEADKLLRTCIADAKNVEVILVSHLIRPMTQEQLDAWKATWTSQFPNLVVHTNAHINPWTGRIEEPGASHFLSCPYGDFGHMFFGATGNVIACCMDLEEEIVFGNVFDDDPADMVEKLVGFYADVTDKKLDHQVCRYCLGVEQRPEGATASAGVQV